MLNILRELYEEKTSLPCAFTEEYEQLCREETELWSKVTPILGCEMVDKLMENRSAIQEQTNFEWFQEGFRLGASLMLELL